MARYMEIDEKIRKSREMGASDEDIIQHASSVDPDFASKYSKSIEMGAKPNEVLDFLSKPKEQPKEKGMLQQAGEFASREALQGTLGAIEGSPLGMVYDLAATGVNLAKKGAHALAGKFVDQPEGSEPAEVPTIADMAEKVGEWVGVDTKPQNSAERATRLAFNLKEMGKKAVGWGIQEGSALMKEIKAVASSAPIAAVAVAAKDTQGIPEWATLATLSLGVPAVVQGVRTGVREGSQVVKDFLKNKALFDVGNVSLKPGQILDSFKAEWNNARKEALNNLKSGAFTPDQYQKIKPFLDIAAERNIPINLGALTDSATLKNVERIAKKRGLEGENLNTFIQKSAEQWANQAEDLSRRISRTHKFSQQGEVADALLSDVTRKKQQDLAKEYKDLYNIADKGLANSEKLPVEEVESFAKSLSAVSQGTSGSLIPTAAEKSTGNIARKAEKSLLVEPKQVGRPELESIRFETGKTRLQQKTSEAAKGIEESTQTFERARTKADQITKRVQEQKTKLANAEKRFEEAQSKKKGIKSATASQTKEYLKAKEAVSLERKALRKLEDAEKQAKESISTGRKTVQEAEVKQADRLIKTQEDFETIFQDEAKNMKFDPQTGEIKFIKPINGQTLIKTIRSLHQYLEWDHPATKNMLNPFLNQVKTTLGRVYGKSHPKEYAAYLKGNEKFKEAIGIYGEDAAFKKWGIKSNATPEELLKTIDSFSRFKQFEKTFGTTPQGKELIDELKRLKVKQQLEPIFENWKPGKVNKGLNKLLKDPEFQYMLEKSVRTDLKRLQDLDRRLEVVSRDIYAIERPQQASDSKEFLSMAMKVIDPISAILTFGGTKGVQAASKRMSDAYASILFDPNITHELVRIGEESLKAAANPKKSPGLLKRLQADLDLLFSNIIQSEAIVAASEATGRIDQED